MRYKPHDYQHQTSQFICENPRAAIFLGMGMGKTISTLTALQDLMVDYCAVGRALIIAPLRVARDTWPAELHKWDHLKELTYSTILGTPKQRDAAVAADADIYIINRENIPWLVKNHGRNWKWDTVVIDELSSFKNHRSKRFLALRSMLPKIDRMIGLTGTPSPNSLLDLWAPYRLLDEGKRLGRTLTRYRDEYFLPDKRNGYQVFTWKLRPGADDHIYDAISDMTLSMRTTDYLDLPPLTITQHPVVLSEKDRRHYNQLKNTMVVELGGQTIDAASAAVLYGKLQQLASGAIHTDDGVVHVHDGKLDALEDVVEAANGHTVLVAYWFTHEKDRILERFPQARPLETAEDMKDWCAGNIPVGLIHPASAGHGLNLQTGGHNLVWFTLPWSLEYYEQTNARLFRQGQDQPVSVIQLVAQHTVDENVLKALGNKHLTQDELVRAVSDMLRKEPVHV